MNHPLFRMMNQDKLKGYGAAIAATILMGSLGIFVRNTAASAQVVTLARFGLGFLFLAAWRFLHEGSAWRPARPSGPLVLSGIFIALGIMFYTRAINLTSLANAVFLLYLAPLIAVGLAAILLREWLTWLNLLLLGMAFLGFLLILEFRFSLSPHSGYGWGLLSALFYALFIVTNRWIPSQVSGPDRSFYQLGSGAVALLPFLTAADAALSHHDRLWLLAIGFFPGFLALSLMILAVKYLTTPEYGTISYLEPLVATLIGWSLYDERLSLLQGGGCLLIFLCGLGQVSLSRRRRIGVMTPDTANVPPSYRKR